ncbi:MAG: aminodeoxychorismate lyase [Micavibrio sp.]|nr:MAG: aminodeoxychorismate lyase [Micavibrio sp.]
MSSKPGKLVLGFLVYSFTIVIVVAVASLWWLDHEFRKPGPLTEAKLFEVQLGASSGGIAELLLYEGAIRDMYIFKYAARITGAQSDLKAGEYQLQPGMSARDILSLMRKGTTFGRRFTIREGLTSYEIVQILNGIEELSGDITKIPVEGTLLPNTYDYRRSEDRSEILTRLEREMENTVLTACRILLERVGGSTLKDMLDKECSPAPAPLKTIRDVLTLASIVEKETGVAGERKRVAGVFINRLRQSIALQTDPTVIYAITKGRHKSDGRGPLGRRLLTKDLQIDNPYNTYKYPGLPPGPIANPGRASIEAVLEAEEHEYIFFVADGSGGHIFAKTLAEHNRNVAEWRKIRRSQKK